MAQEEIIRRRLLADGEGNGDDRRLTNFYRTFLSWFESLDGDDSDHSMLLKMDVQLAQAECSFQKAHKVHQMNEEEIYHYRNLCDVIDRKIEEAQVRILDCKKELQEAKQIRKHKQEYDAMANLIEEHPDRRETREKIESVQGEIQEQEDKFQKLQKKMELRKKQFHVLLVALQELQEVISADDKNFISADVSEPAGEEEKKASTPQPTTMDTS